MKKLTKNTPIVRGSRWPPGFGYLTVSITGGFPTAAATAWDWFSEFGVDDQPTATVSVTAAGVAHDDGGIELSFALSDGESVELEEGTWRVEFVSYDDTGERSVYHSVTGQAKVIGNWE